MTADIQVTPVVNQPFGILHQFQERADIELLAATSAW
jgi:hypothetical protein